MTYTEATSWVNGLTRTNKTPGLTTMQTLMHALGNPQSKLKFVHVAGTNGKGSALMMTASVLKEAGYKTGANISPYVLDFRERFLIDGEMIEEERLAAILTTVRSAAESQRLSLLGFQAVTAAALVYFAQENCEIVCLEAGIGGRYDATNVVENTLVAYIMRVGIDHTELLGDTLEEIATDKCGIFKNNCDVISYPEQPSEVAAIIEQQAEQADCPLVVPEPADFTFLSKSPYQNKISYGGYQVEIPFLGRHQALNAAVAIEGALALWRHGFSIEDEHIIAGIQNTKFPARIEIIDAKPLVILDGAHNEDSAKALAATLCAANMDGLTAIAGVLDDKPADDILAMLSPYVTSLYAVEPNSPRALSAEILADNARQYIKKSFVCDDVATALELAQEDGNPILVFGSFYLAAEVRRLLQG